MKGASLANGPAVLRAAPRPDAELWAAGAPLVVIALAVLLCPVAIAPVPPLWDYPNHLARIFLLSGAAANPPLVDWYQVTWDSWTNVAVDWAAASFARIAGWVVAGRVAVALATMLPPLGGVMLWRSLHGRLTAWPLVFALMALSTSLLGGFLNFQIGVGLALIAASFEPRLSQLATGTAIAARAVVATLLIGVHLFGLLFYIGLLAGLALGPRWSALRGRLPRLMPLLPAIGLPVLLFLSASPHLPGAQVGADVGSLAADLRDGWLSTVADPGAKLLRAGMTIFAYRLPLDMLALGAAAMPLAIAACALRVRLHAGLMASGLGFTLLFLLAPDRLGGTYWIDSRFAVMAPLTLAAAVAPTPPPFSGRVCAALLLALVCAKTALVASVWDDRQADVASLARALKAAAPGRTILPLRADAAAAASEGRSAVLGGNSIRHLATLALPLRQDFVPTVFAARGKQPIQVRPAMMALAEPEGGELGDVAALYDPATMAAESAVAPYLPQWQKFDYVLVLGADGWGSGSSAADRRAAETSGAVSRLDADARLRLVADEGFARLYRRTDPAER